MDKNVVIPQLDKVYGTYLSSAWKYSRSALDTAFSLPVDLAFVAQANKVADICVLRVIPR